METLQKYITVKEASKILKISKRTIYRKIKEGSIPCKKIGSKIIRIPSEYLKN